MRRLKLPIVALALGLMVLATVAWSAQAWFHSQPGDGATAEAATLDSDQGSGPSGIWVTGTGKVSVMPDLAIVSLGVQADAETVAEARDKAAASMQTMLDALKAFGILDNDIQTQYFSIQPKYSSRQVTRCPEGAVLPPEASTPDFPPEKLPYVAGCWQESDQVLVGYTVANQVTVKVRNLDIVGKVVDATAQAGGDSTRVNGVSFTIDNDDAARAHAREQAAKEAIAKAQQFAQLTGVTLGKLQYLTETGYSVPQSYMPYDSYMKGGEAASMPTPISTGQLDVTASVHAVFAIQ
ncbi:MAG: SIMPL domain-containing protein [Chloroflexota bacterium]